MKVGDVDEVKLKGRPRHMWLGILREREIRTLNIRRFSLIMICQNRTVLD